MDMLFLLMVLSSSQILTKAEVFARSNSALILHENYALFVYMVGF